MKRYFRFLLTKGVLLTLSLSFLLLWIAFGTVIKNANHTYFENKGDGMQSYYTTLYHIEYDAGYWHFEGMNYPYGEQVFYTGNQPLFSNVIKLLSHHGLHLSGYVVGFMNLAMLFSIVLGALGIYLVLRELKLPDLYAGFAAVGVAFLSPQINRMSCHFTLSYVFVIPFFLWLIMRFHRNPDAKKSVLIGIYTFVMATIHPYFLSMLGMVAFLYHAAVFLSNKTKSKQLYWQTFYHFFIQVILPFALIQLILYCTDVVTDRTHNPWGILYYVAIWESIFLPIGKPLGPVIGHYIRIREVEWEGIAFVGFVSTITVIVLSIISLYKLFTPKRKTFFKVSENFLLNCFFWAAVLLLLYSLGIPFIFRLEFLLDYLGFLKQMRGLARFSWVFYYVINIYAFCQIHRLAQKLKYIPLRWLLYTLPLFVLYYDAYGNVTGMFNINNRIPVLDDTGNTLEEDQWINKISPAGYQAIIALPYFHVGSESIWIKPEQSDISKYTYIISLKTGLPVTDVSLSRTSLSQTYKNIALVCEPYRLLKITTDFKNTKPFLVIACEQDVNGIEKALLAKAKPMFRNAAYGVYSFSYETLIQMYREVSDNAEKEFNAALRDNKTGSASNADSSYVYLNFNKRVTENHYAGAGAYSGRAHDHNTLYQGILPNALANHEYVLSFWFDHLTTDLYPRSTVEFIHTDSAGNVISNYYSNLFRLLKTIDGNWGLDEYHFRLRSPKDKITLSVWNDDIRDNKKMIHFDELLIRPATSNIYYRKDSIVFKNDKFYKATGKYTSSTSTGNNLYADGRIIVVDKPEDELTKRINETIAQICTYDAWMEIVRKKARDKHISLDSALILDARYMVKAQDEKALLLKGKKADR